MLDIILLLRKFLVVDVVNIDGSIDLSPIDPIVVVTHYFDIGKIGLKAAFQKD